MGKNYTSELIKLREEEKFIKSVLDTFCKREQRDALFQQLKKLESLEKQIEFKLFLEEEMRKNEKKSR